MNRDVIKKQNDNALFGLGKILNAQRDELRRVSNIRGISPVKVSDTAGGYLIGLEQLPTIKTGYKWVNASSEACPAFGVIKITGCNWTSGELVLQGDKAGSEFSRIWAINGDEEVDDGKKGICYVEGLLPVKYSGSLGSATMLGPKNEDWVLHAGYPGWDVFGGIDRDGTSLAVVRLSPIDKFAGKTTQQVSGSGGTIKIRVGLTSDSGWQNISISNYLLLSNQTIEPNTSVICMWLGGQWIIAECSCPDEED